MEIVHDIINRNYRIDKQLNLAMPVVLPQDIFKENSETTILEKRVINLLDSVP
jgi:hypothetical protein